jgi:hypothetical protein
MTDAATGADARPEATPVPTSDPVRAARRRTRVWLIVSQALYVCSLLPWLAFAGLSVMAFDAPGSTEKWQPWVFVGVIWSYPLLPFTTSIISWILYARGRLRGAAITTAIPLAVLLLVVAALVVVTVVTTASVVSGVS